MSARLFVLEEERWKRRNARVLEQNDLAQRRKRTQARLIQEAIDDAILNKTPCDYETIMGVVRQWENGAA